MACIYKYKGKKYTKEQFHNLVSKQLMGIPVHIEEQEEAKASPQTIKEVREFLKRLDVESIMDISIGGRKLSPADVVNLLYQAQSMVQGEVPDYFSADAMYFITELIERLNPKLFNKLFKEIHKYGIYEEVFSEDKYQDAYREKNGSVNVRAIKKDAIAKLLEQVFILKNNEIEENHSLIQYLSNWWETVKSFLEKAFQKPGFTLFDETDLVIEEEAPPIEIDEYINLNEPTTIQNVPLSQPTGTKLDIEKLFNENPELANKVYEALGFGQSNYYEGNIKPEPNTIFVFGSNPEGRHGAGAAKVAIEQFGAIYGQGEGLQGNSYALPTKDLRVKENGGLKSISPEQITNSIKKLYEVAKQNPDKQFKVAYRNTTDTSLNGYTGLEMIEMFNQAGTIPSNVIFSKEWVDTGKLNIQSQITPQQELISSIYSKLGNKTKSSNIIIKPWGELKDVTRAITPEGIVSTRIKMSNAHFGNPFTSDTRLKNLIQTKSTKESVERYINWILTGETGEHVFTGIQPEELENQREWILEQLKSGKLKGKPIFYYKELGEPSHATALDYLINEYNWDTQITPQQKQQAQQLYSQYLSQNPNGSVEGFKSWLDNNQSNIQYQRQIDLQAEQDEVLEEFANSLSERFNISFDLVSEEDARAMFPEYTNEPAFFDPKTKKAYLVKGKANKTSAIHEIFTHPFLLQIEKTNSTLYKNLLKEAKNNKSVVDYVDNLYGTNRNNDHEYIARAIDLAVQGELDQQKDKTLLERIQDFFNQLSDYLKKLFNIPEVFSSSISPNITLQQLAQFAMYGKGKMNLNPAQENIEYSLKATNIIVKNLDRIKQWEKNKSISEDVLWDKIQKDLRVPKEQLELVKNSEGNTVEEKLLNFANQYSFTVEINTAKSELYKSGYFAQESVYGEWSVYDAQGNTVEDGLTQEEAIRRAKQFNENNSINTQYYSNLTVPGGTNYTENEIVTPTITPSIKGHAQFSTDNGIGWFRSDELTSADVNDRIERGEPMNVFEELAKSANQLKTRRILEVQSDLFQKGRNNDVLAGRDPRGKRLIDASQEQENFLQLLNKDNNWVTFFVKSIIQDSAKKGYEKVLFPKGDTASKIEGHQTLEEFKKQKEDRIKERTESLEIAKEVKKYLGKDATGNKIVENYYYNIFPERSIAKDHITGKETDNVDLDNLIKRNENEINQLKQELERVEREGFGALKPIYNFYENTVTNILKKQGYNPVEIIDEYGNTWNEITIDENRDNQNIVFQKTPQSNSSSQSQQSSNTPNTDSTSQDNQEETKSEVIDDTKGKAIFDKLVEEGKKIVLKDGPKKGDSFYEVLGEKVGRVSDVVKEWYARHFGAGDLTKSEFQTAIDEIKREKGTEGHKDIENIILRYVDKSTGLLRENPLPMPVGIMGAGTDYMNKLDVFVKDMLNSYPPGTRFLVEQKVYNPATKTAGTIDFIAIEPSGKVGFRDWKFTDIKESQEDVPWFKKGAWREQSKEYKKILKAVYGVTSFGQIRTHPFLTQYRFEGEKGQKELKLKGISVPPFDVSAIRDLRMLPVSEKYESTGNKKLDALIDALNTQYEKWQKVRGFDEDRDARNQRNNDLERAIRTLQVQQQVGGLLKTGNSILYATKNHVNALVKQSRQEKLTKKEIRTIAGKLLEAVGTLELFTDLDNIFQEVNLGKEDKEAISKLAKESRDVINTIKNEVYGEVGEIIANGYGIKHLSAPERVVDYIGRNFKSLSSAETKASQVLWRIVERFTGASRIRYSEAVDRLNTMKRNLEEFAASRGFTVAELVEKLKAKDARGWTGDLISEIDQKFYKELKEKQKEIVNAKEWIKENIDMDSYLEWYKEALANKEKYERSQVYIPENSTENEAEQTRRINKWKDKYDVNGKYFHTLANDALRFHPKKSVWTSKEYQEILNLGDNNPLLQFHTYWVERMKHSKKLGMIHHHAYKTFFPNVSKNALEMAFEGIRNPNKQKHLRIFDSLKEDFANDLIIDPVTKQPIQNITANFVFDLGSRRIDKSTNEEFLDYSQKSDDVFKIMALWEHEIVKFELRTEVESEVKLLSAIEKAKKHLEVDRRTGNLEEVTGNEINSKYFDNFMDAFLYGRRYAEDMKGTMNVNINNTVDKLNGFFKRTLNVEPFPRSEDDNIAISVNKVIEWMNKWFQLKTLGLNVPVSLANAVGGKLNSYIKSGKHFSKGDLMKADIMLASAATTGEQGKKVLAMLEYFVPLTDDQKDMLARKLSIKGKVHMANLSSDWLFYLMRGSDKFVQYPVAIAFAMNTMVKDGELINIREYVRGKYEKGMFRLSPSERIALEKKMEAEIEELQKQSILFTGKLVENKFVLEGITRDSETVYKHINKILGFSKDVLGAMEPNDFYQYRMNILTKSAMMFKSWIPRMAKDRFGKLQYDVGKDDWEWGRVNIFFSALLSNLRDSVKMLIGVASGKESLIQRALKLYAIKQAEFGADEFMTEEAFVNMYIAGVQQMMRETLMWLSLAGMVLASAAAVPDDDDEYKGAYKWVARLFDKFYDELSFFYSPKSAIEIGNGSLFPAMGTLLDIQNFLSKGGQDLFYTVIGDEEKTDKIKTSKYLFKAIPVTKEIMQYLAIFNEEFAKEFGIVITTNNRNR